MRTGRFKVFKHLNEWFDEKRMLHRKDGKIVPERDDIESATRYAVMMLRCAGNYVDSVAPRVPSVDYGGYNPLSHFDEERVI